MILFVPHEDHWFLSDWNSENGVYWLMVMFRTLNRLLAFEILSLGSMLWLGSFCCSLRF